MKSPTVDFTILNISLKDLNVGLGIVLKLLIIISLLLSGKYNIVIFSWKFNHDKK